MYQVTYLDVKIVCLTLNNLEKGEEMNVARRGAPIRRLDCCFFCSSSIVTPTVSHTRFTHFPFDSVIS